MRLIDAEPIIEMLKRVRKDADSPRRDLDLLNLQQLLEFAPEIAPPPNDPLTLDELREMDGEPVWVTPLAGRPPRWCFVVVPESVGMGYVRNQTRKNGFVCDGITGHFRTYGKTWLAYRRKPEEEQP